MKLNNIKFSRIVGDNIDIIPTILNKNGNTLIDHNNQITQPGIYTVYFNNKAEEKIAFNINSSENNIKTIDAEKLKINKNLSVIDSDFKLSENIMKNIDGKQYWKYALLISLLFFGIEILFIKKLRT